MKKLWMLSVAVILIPLATLAWAETEEKREVIIKLASDDGGGLSTFDLSELEVGESRELTADSGRVITVQRDAAGYLLDLGDGKTMRIDDEGHGVMAIGGGAGHRSIHVDKHVVRLGGDGEEGHAPKVMIFRSENGEVTELEGEGTHWTSISGGGPHVMVFKSEDGTITTLDGDGDTEWTDEDGNHKVVKRIVRVGGDNDETVDLLIESLQGGADMDDAEVQELIERLKANHECGEGEDCEPKVIVVKKRVEKTSTDEE